MFYTICFEHMCKELNFSLDVIVLLLKMVISLIFVVRNIYIFPKLASFPKFAVGTNNIQIFDSKKLIKKQNINNFIQCFKYLNQYVMYAILEIWRTFYYFLQWSQHRTDQENDLKILCLKLCFCLEHEFSWDNSPAKFSGIYWLYNLHTKTARNWAYHGEYLSDKLEFTEIIITYFLTVLAIDAWLVLFRHKRASWTDNMAFWENILINFVRF